MKLSKQQVLHFLGLLGVSALGVVADVLGESHWVWAPIALALVVDVRKALVGKVQPAAVLLVLVVPLLGGATCTKTIVNGPTPPADAGPSFVNCSDASLHQAVLNILPAVENALATDSYEAALRTLIASIGGPLALDEVECAVQWVGQNAAMQETATADSLEATKAAHAKAWLAKQNVQFKGGAQ